MSITVRIILGSIFIAAIIFASQEWIFRAAPLEVATTSSVPIYGPGSKINGIDWQPYYSDLQFYIRNPSKFDYDNLDAEISTDLVMNDIQPLRVLGSCKIVSTHPPVQVHWQEMEGGKPIGPVDSPSASYKVVPLDKNGKPIIPVSGADWSYRIRCDKVPSNSQFDFFAALAVVNQSTSDTPIGASLYGTPRPAKWVSIRAEFQTSGQNREKKISECPIGTNCEIDKSKQGLDRWFGWLSR